MWLTRCGCMTLSTLCIGTALLVCGCGDSTTSQPSAQDVTKLTPEKKFEALLKKAEAGDVQAQQEVGGSYFNGEGVQKDEAKGLFWTEKAAAKGNPTSQYNLGLSYAEGLGVPKDAAKALEWLQKSAMQGDADGQNGLGYLYYLGQGVPKDAAKAAEWWQKSATQGNAQAQGRLAYLYQNGEGVLKDTAKALDLYKKAATQGEETSQYNLSRIYDEGKAVPMDATKALEWRKKAAAQGHAEAQYELGWQYVGGLGIERDLVLAYAWFNLAAVSSNVDVAKRAAGFRQMYGGKLTATELSESQRLSSEWRKGKILARENRSTNSPASLAPNPGALTKRATGTLFLVSKTGHAITNYHIVHGCQELRIEGRQGVVNVVSKDTVNDLALLQLPGEISAAATIASEPNKLRQGEEVVVFGFPLNSVLSSGGNLTPGVISALTGLGNNTNQIQLTAPIQPGSSGSPVLNKKAEVVGVVSMKLSDVKMAQATGQVGQNLNFAVGGLTLKAFLDTNKVAYSTGGFLSMDKSNADLADEARKWTMVVECWK